ncbi:hypothetical protein VaNZ11_005888, partial [Volvox africanus]
YTSPGVAQYVHFRESLRLVGVPLPPTAVLVFELYVAKQAVAGMPSREALVAWAFCPLMMLGGGMLAGKQTLPLFRQPLMIAAQRKYSYESASLDFEITKRDGNPGEVASATLTDAAAGGGPDASGPSDGRGGEGSVSRLEDVPGVSVDAWMRVTRGVVPSDSYTPGDGFVICLDGARFLPANVTITKVTVSIWGSNRQPLGSGGFYGISWPDSDAMNPRFSKSATLGMGSDKFDDSTATLLFKVTTLERWSRVPCVLGWGLLNLFIDAKTQQQPLSSYVLDYALNQGAFQIPLHTRPPAEPKLSAGSLRGMPRVPCASLLLRILNPELHRLQRRKKPPEFSDRVYDSTRDLPTPLERRLYNKYLRRRKFLVREAARLLVTGRPMGRAGRQDQQGGATDNDDLIAMAGADAVLPNSDVELMDWIDRQLSVTGGPGPETSDRQLPYNLSSAYYPDLGFCVAVDGALRLPRGLPAAAFTTFAPPGSFYQDSPLVDDVRVTLDYDLTAPLANPRWTDGFVHFSGALYERGMCIIVDVRLVVPATGTSAPAGWTAVRLFEREGEFVASGYYHLPLFAGVPSRFLIQEVASMGDLDSVIANHLQSGRIQVHEECASVLIRVMDLYREGQLDIPATQMPLASLRRPGYCSLAPQLGPKQYDTMCKSVTNKTYAQAKPRNMPDDVWVEMINDAIIKVAGLAEDEEEEDDGDIAAAAAPMAQAFAPPAAAAAAAANVPGTALSAAAAATMNPPLRTAASMRRTSTIRSRGSGGAAAQPPLAPVATPVIPPPTAAAGPAAPAAGALTAPPPPAPATGQGAMMRPPYPWPMPFRPMYPPYPMYRPPFFPPYLPVYGMGM